jgi:hypothetical protein
MSSTLLIESHSIDGSFAANDVYVRSLRYCSGRSREESMALLGGSERQSWASPVNTRKQELVQWMDHAPKYSHPKPFGHCVHWTIDHGHRRSAHEGLWGNN